MDANTSAAITLVAPDLERMPHYVDALRRGWSPNNARDVSKEQLALFRESPERLLSELTRQDGTIDIGGGKRVPRLPSRVFWIFDGEFCGTINLRYMPGTEALPPYCSGHIGYAIVPWKQRRGYATAALGMVLQVARALGLARVQVTCDTINDASRKVILANGGKFAGIQQSKELDQPAKLVFWIAT
ncbi:MAG TPA: GNAT family N-acetyltransferase [Alphaproteobacteria bacterium]|nr:GNAT family N-acetyltransferase [Alphaproteobacteria bacterium]